MGDQQRAFVLERLERGEIDADEAVRQLSEEPAPETARQVPENGPPPVWRHWWLVILAVGVIMLGAGYSLVANGGWWWLAAGPVLALGVGLTVLGGSMCGSPWIQLRVETDENGTQGTFGLSLPLPLRPAIWALKVFGGFRGLDKTGVDELLLAMQGAIGTDSPAIVDVQKADSGENVRVYIG